MASEKRIVVDSLMSMGDALKTLITATGARYATRLGLLLGEEFAIDQPDAPAGHPRYYRLKINAIGPSQHGDLPGGTLHAEAIPGEESGFLSAAYALMLSQATALATAGKLALRGAAAQLVGAWFESNSGTGIKATTGAVRGAKDETLFAWRNNGGSSNIIGMRLDNEHTDRIVCGELCNGFDFFVGTGGDVSLWHGPNFDDGTNYVRFQWTGTQGQIIFREGHAKIISSPDHSLALRHSGIDRFTVSGVGVGFNGKTPQPPLAIARNYTGESEELEDYTTVVKDAAYTGIGNVEIGDVYAKVADVNDLRIAYENERAAHENTKRVLGSLILHLQTNGLIAGT